MTEVLHSPSHLSSPTTSDALFCSSQTQSCSNPSPSRSSSPNPNSNSPSLEVNGDDRRVTDGLEVLKRRRKKESEELSLLALLVTVFRKSLIVCKTNSEELCSMDIGWPTNVRHVAHVTYDNFDGFLGLPDEFEPDVPRTAPSASTSVFGVSTDSMQLSYDSRGNCVPAILILMQRRLYAQGGLQAEGIFRINALNSQEEFVRDQLNRGLIPEDIDVHCLAGVIKAWFRELPGGVLDPLSPDQVMQCETEEECAELVQLLPPTEAALLDWAINLMADVAQEEHFNKMNAHSIAMVFAPNMTQMTDALTALMYAVQVMNFLKTLIMKMLREREDSRIGVGTASCLNPSDESGDQSPSQPCLEDLLVHGDEGCETEEEELYTDDDEGSPDSIQNDREDSDESPFPWDNFKGKEVGLIAEFKYGVRAYTFKDRIIGHSSGSNTIKESLNVDRLLFTGPIDKSKSASNFSRISSRIESIESWP